MPSDQPTQAQASATKRKVDDIDGDALSPVSAVDVPLNLSSAVQPLYCSVCWEVCVSTMALVPCGHGMCLACSKKAAKCPECRQPIDFTVRSWAMDSTVSTLMDAQSKSKQVSFFPSDDVRSYNDRLKNIKNVASLLSPSRRSAHPLQRGFGSNLGGSMSARDENSDAWSAESEVAAPESTPEPDTDQETDSEAITPLLAGILGATLAYALLDSSDDSFLDW
jgi:Zinc finger, C3HC4 type (RING finger)